MGYIKGTITKGVGGFYYVACGDIIYECRARGIFRKDGITPLVGDEVDITVDDAVNLRGTVDNIHPRKNVLLRPPVANVSQVAVIIAAASPAPNFLTVDKLIAAAELAGIEILICVNKTDVADSKAASIAEIYEKAGFPVVSVSAETRDNIDALTSHLVGKITVFAGNSGVGKSSILNLILGGDVMRVGAVSEKISRGRHTTRHSELLRLPTNPRPAGTPFREGGSGGFVIDTPGFSAFELDTVKCEDVAELFREFEKYGGMCKFTGCAHVKDKGCAIVEAVGRGEIAQSRHESYVAIYENAKKVKDWER